MMVIASPRFSMGLILSGRTPCVKIGKTKAKMKLTSEKTSDMKPAITASCFKNLLKKQESYASWLKILRSLTFFLFHLRFSI